MGPVFVKGLRDQRRGIVGWSIGIVALVAVMAALWPSIRGMPNLDEFLEGYPEALRELFAIDALSTGAGFLNAELFTFMLPVMFIVFGIARGARILAGEEEGGSLEPLLATPVPRARMLLEKAATVAVAVLALGIVLFVSAVVASEGVGMGAGVWQLLLASAVMVLLGIEYAMLALFVGAATGRRALALAIPGAFAAAAYVLYVTGALVEGIEPWAVLSPFELALEGGPIGAGARAQYLLLLAGGVVLAALAVPAFERRDVT